MKLWAELALKLSWLNVFFFKRGFSSFAPFTVSLRKIIGPSVDHFLFPTKRLEVSCRALRSSADVNTSLQVELPLLKQPFPGISVLDLENDTVSK